jgi:hypothetical protein
VRQDVLKFRQHDEGLCGLYTIVNALSVLFPEHMTHVGGAVLVSRLAEAVPGDMRSIIQEGTDRVQMDAMLKAARAWTDEHGWPAWECRPMHPVHGEHSHVLWEAVCAELGGNSGRKKKHGRSAAADGLMSAIDRSAVAHLPGLAHGQSAIALVGFGDYHKESTFYEPHWTCVERVTERLLFLRDSDEYTRIPRAETGIRPEDGWEIEDCYVLKRPPLPDGRGTLILPN